MNRKDCTFAIEQFSTFPKSENMEIISLLESARERFDTKRMLEGGVGSAYRKNKSKSCMSKQALVDAAPDKKYL